MNKYLTLFLTFAKIGAFTFGGGYAMIPLIQRDVVETRKWMTDAEVLDIVAVAESTPGPIAVNTATFVGYRVGGVGGAALATLGVVLPSFVIIYLISLLLKEFSSLKPVRYAFAGIRAGVLALIIKGLWSMYKQCPKHVFSYILMAAAFAVAAFTDVNVIFIIIACGVLGLIYALIARGKEKKHAS